MNWSIRFSKDDMAKAQAEGKIVFAMGFNGAGRGETFVRMDEEPATTLWLMAMHLSKGDSIQDALAKAEATVAEAKAKKAALEGEVAA